MSTTGSTSSPAPVRPVLVDPSDSKAMRALNLKFPADRRPAYLRIAEAVRAAIQRGQARPGEAIPSTRELARLARVHRHTVMAALSELIAEGWLVARPGDAYRVCPALPDRFFTPAALARASPMGHAAEAGTRPAAGRAWRLVREPDSPLPPATGGFRYRFQSGVADLRLFPFAELRSWLADVLRRSGERALAYGPVAGPPRFIAGLAHYLRRVRSVPDRDVIVTHGSQEAIFLVGQLLLAPGDVAAVEELGYPPAWDALRASGARLAGVPMDGEGILPDALDRLCRRRRPRLVYVTPLHQYPTTVTLTAARRLALYEVAARHGLPILEDDYDHEFHYRCQPLAPLVASDPAGLVIYATTLSKVLYPSARVGCLVTPRALATPLAKLKRIVSRQNDSLVLEALARWMETGGLERHLRRMRRAYEARLDAMVRSLEALRAGGLDVSWRVPDGGMALWLATPWDCREVAGAAARAGVFVHPESAFRLDGGHGHHLRLGFAGQTPREIEAGLAALARAAAGLRRRRGDPA
jgi:GntR family transcriptional regulator/MocR family aminotransferase